MITDPDTRIDIEIGFFKLVGATRGLSSLLSTAREIDASPDDMAAIFDLIAEKSQTLARLSGFNIP